MAQIGQWLMYPDSASPKPVFAGAITKSKIKILRKKLWIKVYQIRSIQKPFLKKESPFR